MILDRTGWAGVQADSNQAGVHIRLEGPLAKCDPRIQYTLLQFAALSMSTPASWIIKARNGTCSTVDQSMSYTCQRASYLE